MKLPTMDAPSHIACPNDKQDAHYVGHAFYSLAIYRCESCGKVLEYDCSTEKVLPPLED